MQPEHASHTAGDKLFSRGQIFLAGVLGGPLGAAWAAYKTANALSAPIVAKRLIWTGIGLLALMAIVVELLPTDMPNNPALAIVFFMPVVIIFDGSLRNRYKAAIEGGAGKHSWWKATGTGFVAFLVTGVVIIAFYLIVPLQPINTLEYGNNIVYYEGDATEQDARSLARFLENEGVFHPNAVWSLTLVYPRGQIGTVILEIPFLEPVENTETHEMLRRLRDIVQSHYAGRKVQIDIQNAIGVTTLRIAD